MTAQQTPGTSYWLPRSKAMLALPPGKTLTSAQTDAADEFMLLMLSGQLNPLAFEVELPTAQAGAEAGNLRP